MCAGKGERFYPHTHILPKSLLPFLNLPLASYNLFLLKNLKVNQIIANTYKHHELLVNSLTRSSLEIKDFLPPVFSHEPKLLGSAGGLWKVRNFLEQETSFYYLNGDSLFWPHKEKSLSDFYISHIQSGALASFLCIPSPQTKGVIWANKNKQVCSFLKKTNDDCNSYHFCGLALFSRTIFKLIKPKDRHIFTDVLEKECLKKDLRVHSVSDLEVLDMNQLPTYLNANFLAVQCLLKEPSLSGFLMTFLDAFSPWWRRFQGENYFSGTSGFFAPENKKDLLFCGKDVKGLNNLKVRDFAVIGNGSKVCSPCQVSRSVVKERFLLKDVLYEDSLLI